MVTAALTVHVSLLTAPPAYCAWADRMAATGGLRLSVEQIASLSQSRLSSMMRSSSLLGGRVTSSMHNRPKKPTDASSTSTLCMSRSPSPSDTHGHQSPRSPKEASERSSYSCAPCRSGRIGWTRYLLAVVVHEGGQRLATRSNTPAWRSTLTKPANYGMA